MSIRPGTARPIAAELCREGLPEAPTSMRAPPAPSPMGKRNLQPQPFPVSTSCPRKQSKWTGGGAR